MENFEKFYKLKAPSISIQESYPKEFVKREKSPIELLNYYIKSRIETKKTVNKKQSERKKDEISKQKEASTNVNDQNRKLVFKGTNKSMLKFNYISDERNKKNEPNDSLLQPKFGNPKTEKGVKGCEICSSQEQENTHSQAIEEDDIFGTINLALVKDIDDPIFASKSSIVSQLGMSVGDNTGISKNIFMRSGTNNFLNRPPELYSNFHLNTIFNNGNPTGETIEENMLPENGIRWDSINEVVNTLFPRSYDEQMRPTSHSDSKNEESEESNTGQLDNISGDKEEVSDESFMGINDESNGDYIYSSEDW